MKILGRHLLNFILTIVIVCFTILLTIQFTILNEKYMMNLINKNHYIDNVYKNIISNIENNTASLGVEIKANEMISKEVVKTDITDMILSFYQDKEIEVDKVNISKRIENNLLDHEPTEEEKIEIKKLTEKLTSIYEEEILYSHSVVNKIPHYIKIIKNLVMATQILLLLVAINIIAITILIIKKKENISISLLASGLILISIKLLVGNNYQKILIMNSNLSNLIIQLFGNIINLILFFGIIYFFSGLLARIKLALKEKV